MTVPPQTLSAPTPPHLSCVESAVPAGAASEDREIAAAQRDPAAFAILYRRHAPAIARFVRRRLGAGPTTDDLVAETFVTALEQLSRFQGRELGFRSWLYRLATTRVGRWARQVHRRWGRLDSDPVAPPPENGDRREWARRALLALRPRDQDVLSLHYLEELPLAEVAAILGVRPGTVKSRLSRAREAMRRELQRRSSR